METVKPEPGTQTNTPTGSGAPRLTSGGASSEAEGDAGRTDTLLDLLERWEERFRQGVDTPPEALGLAETTLLDMLRQRIEQRRRLYALLDIGKSAREESQEGAATLPAFPGHETLGEIGHGGMGVVYKARDVELNRLVAIKTIAEGRHASAAQRERFRAEALAVARLQHANIIAVHQVGDHDRCPYLVLELAEGGSLAQRLVEGPLPTRQAAELVATLARAVHAAHQAGIVHRDLKPKNVLLTTDGIPKLCDFGLAKLLDADSGRTLSGQVLGTPSFMAPELAEGHAKQAGPAADIYSLGAILYQALTGRPPFEGGSELETLKLVTSTEAVPPRRLRPDVPKDLETICLKCLEKEPRKR
jgi:serine/threonine-protein kinase